MLPERRNGGAPGNLSAGVDMAARVLTCAGKVLTIPSPGGVLTVDPASLPTTVTLNMPNITGNPDIRGMPTIAYGSFQATLVVDPTGKVFPHYAFNSTPVWPNPPDYSDPHFVGVPSGVIFLYPASGTLQWNANFTFLWNRGYSNTVAFCLPVGSGSQSPVGTYTLVSNTGYFEAPNCSPPYTVSTP
jgi:hypothetical protein